MHTTRKFTLGVPGQVRVVISPIVVALSLELIINGRGPVCILIVEISYGDLGSNY